LVLVEPGLPAFLQSGTNRAATSSIVEAGAQEAPIMTKNEFDKKTAKIADEIHEWMETHAQPDREEHSEQWDRWVGRQERFVLERLRHHGVRFVTRKEQLELLGHVSNHVLKHAENNSDGLLSSIAKQAAIHAVLVIVNKTVNVGL
jgi:hypothetical protein